MISVPLLKSMLELKLVETIVELSEEELPNWEKKGPIFFFFLQFDLCVKNFIFLIVKLNTVRFFVSTYFEKNGITDFAKRQRCVVETEECFE